MAPARWLSQGEKRALGDSQSSEIAESGWEKKEMEGAYGETQHDATGGMEAFVVVVVVHEVHLSAPRPYLFTPPILNPLWSLWQRT